MEWTNWNWINVFFAVWCFILAKDLFENGHDGLGWCNLFASSANAASIAAILW